MNLRGGGCIFEMSLQNMPTSRAVSLALFMYACCDSAMPLLSCACLCNNSKWCLPSFVSPSSYTVLQCYLIFSLLLPLCIPSFIVTNSPFPSLNTVREVCTKCPLAVNADLLQDLASYKNYRECCHGSQITYTAVQECPS